MKNITIISALLQMKRGQRERWTPCDCTTTTRQARSVSARSLSVDSIFPLKNDAAKGRLPESSTPDGFTVSVPETENPIAEKLNLPVLPFHSSCRSLILSANWVFTSPRSVLTRLSASSCVRRCETAMLSFAIVASCECTDYHESLVARLLDFHYSNAVKNSIYGLESQAQLNLTPLLQQLATVS